MPQLRVLDADKMVGQFFFFFGGERPRRRRPGRGSFGQRTVDELKAANRPVTEVAVDPFDQNRFQMLQFGS